MAKFQQGNKAYIVESNYKVREGKIMKVAAGLYLFKFTEGGGIRIPESRLYATREEAEAAIRK